MFTLPETSRIDVRVFATILGYNMQSASYKLLWLMGTLEEVKKRKSDYKFSGHRVPYGK